MNGYKLTQSEQPRPEKRTAAASATVFSVYCTYLNRTIILNNDTWYYKILAEHPEIKNSHSGLLQELLTGPDKDIFKFRKKADYNRISLYKPLPNFLPYNRYLKIGIKILTSEVAVITTVHGQYDLPSLDVESL